MHPSGKLLFVANYTGGNIASIRINDGGGLNPGIQSVQHLGSGPNLTRQEKAHAHSANISANGRFMYACDLGIDKVMGYAVDLNKGQLTHSDEATTTLVSGSGPRHMAFSTDMRYAFVINELNSTITSCSVDETSGALAVLESVSTLPAKFEGENYCADIHVHPDGTFLYASNRGHNSIAVFRIMDNGQLSMVQTHTTMGDWPRNFGIDPSGKYLFVANKMSDNVVVLKINPESGWLSDVGVKLDVPQPVCILFPDQGLGLMA